MEWKRPLLLCLGWTAAMDSLAQTDRPNILFVIADDQSYPHASAYGTLWIETPGFDWVAQNGCLFGNAFVTSPGSSPSRASILTGRYPWQIAEAGTHASSFPSEYKCFTDMLEEAGYRVGFTGKGWGPGDWAVSGRKRNPAGTPYNKVRLTPPHKGISDIDYAGNFRQFLDKNAGRPFCFWLGANEPHRTYEKDSWRGEGKSTENVDVPPFLPDDDVVRQDLLDYAVEIEWFDSHLQKAIALLKERNLLDNTLIVVTADNGMPFPAAKANCYDAGIHVPLAICWTGKMKGNRKYGEVVSMVDMAPTFLDAAGLPPCADMAGRSLLPLLAGDDKAAARPMAFAGRERHSSARPGNVGYPVRAVRTKNFLYIRNIRPDRWPAGNPCYIDKEGHLSALHRAYFDIDGSPTWSHMVACRDSARVYPLFLNASSKRPYEELYDMRDDSGCLHNLVGDRRYADTLEELRSAMDRMQDETRDYRLDQNGKDRWDSYPRLRGGMRSFPEQP